MEIYKYDKFRDFIRAKIDECESIRGYQSKLAKAAGCQTSYFSKMLQGGNQLTPEHAAGLCEFWQLTQDESEYFLQLVHLDRSGSERLRSMVQRQITKLREKQRELESVVNLDSIQDLQHQSLYYATWEYAAIHILLTIPEFDSLKKISERLNLRAERVATLISDLETIGLLRRKGNWFELTSNRIHIPRSSPFYAFHMSNWYLKNIERVRRFSADDVHYSAIYSLSKKDVATIHAKLMEFIHDLQKQVNQSAEEDLINFTCSFYRF